MVKYVEVFELMIKRDSRILKDRELFKKSLILDRVIDRIIRERVATEQRFTRRSAYEDDKIYVELYNIEKKVKSVAKMLDKIDEIVKNKFESDNPGRNL